MSGASERANGRASGPALQSVFLAVIDHSALALRHQLRIPHNLPFRCHPLMSHSFVMMVFPLPTAFNTARTPFYVPADKKEKKEKKGANRKNKHATETEHEVDLRKPRVH